MTDQPIAAHQQQSGGEGGLFAIPPNVDPISFLLTDGQVQRRINEHESMGLAAFFKTYQERLPEGSKEESILKGERLHVRHFQRHLGMNRLVQSITKADLQQYVPRRLKDKHRELWKALFLEREEIAKLLAHAKDAAKYPVAYPLLAFVAHMGARRSEIVLVRIEDLDCRARTVLIREKKRSRTKAVTFRRIDMSPHLENALSVWLKDHP